MKNLIPSLFELFGYLAGRGVHAKRRAVEISNEKAVVIKSETEDILKAGRSHFYDLCEKYSEGKKRALSEGGVVNEEAPAIFDGENQD